MADIKAQLKAKNGDNLYPVTSLAYVSAVSSGGIVINGNSIYTSAIPQANVYRLTTSLGAKQAKCSAGFRTYVSGATIGQNRYFDIAAPVSSGTVTVSAGSAYRIFATGNTVTVNAEGSASSAGVFGLEGHAAILLTNSSYLKFGTNVVLGSPLQIDAINNCTLRFHDGHCIIDVEDHEAAHAVTVATGTGTGSLYYWANWANTTSASATPAYISFSDALDGTACSFNGVTVNGDKHFVGNGKTLTVVTGTATASSKTYLTNMAISGATITGGTVYATDVMIPSGVTTVISSPLIVSNTLEINGTLRYGGSILYARPAGSCTIYGSSGVLNFSGGARMVNQSFTMIGITVSGFTDTSGNPNGAIFTESISPILLSSCTLTGNQASYGGAIDASPGQVTMIDCVVSGNTGSCPIYLRNSAHLTVSNCELYDTIRCQVSGAGVPQVTLTGSNVVKAGIYAVWGGQSGTLTLTSGSILDLTGNTNATPINPGGGITFEPGGATVYPSAGAGHAYVIDFFPIAGLTNTNALMPGTNQYLIRRSARMQNVIISGYTGTVGGFAQVAQSTYLTFDSCTFSGNSGTDNNGGALAIIDNTATVTCNYCTFDSNTTTRQYTYGQITVASGSCFINNCSFANRNAAQGRDIWAFGSGKVFLSGSNYHCLIGNAAACVYISSGTIMDYTADWGYISAAQIIVETGGCIIKTNAGTAVTVPAGTYTKINSDGTTA